MITKTKFWEKVRKELKEIQRTKQVTSHIMQKIKNIPQNENKNIKT